MELPGISMDHPWMAILSTRIIWPSVDHPWMATLPSLLCQSICGCHSWHLWMIQDCPWQHLTYLSLPGQKPQEGRLLAFCHHGYTTMIWAAPDPTITAYPEEIRLGDVTVGVKHVRTSIAFIVLEAFCFHFYLKSAQAQVLWMLSKCKVQTQIQKNAKFKLKYKSKQGAWRFFSRNVCEFNEVKGR